MFFYGIGISRISHSEKGQRFGDGIAKTMVVDSSKGPPKIWTLIIVVIVISLGVFVWQELQKPQTIEDIEPTTEKEQFSADETINWQTYRNEKYRFEVKYPGEWVLQTEQEADYDTVLFRDPTNKDVLHPKGIVTLGIFMLIEETPFESVEGWFREHFQVGPNRPVPKYSHLKVGHIQAIRFVDPVSIGGCYETISFIKNSTLFKWHRFPPTCDYSDEVFKQMLSTFRFLE